jgi:transcriptional regulator with XRE-family HTH domain
MEDNMLEIGLRLRELREARGATQAQIATLIGASDETVISKIENGKRGLGSYELATLCEYFGVASDSVLFGSSAEAPVGALLRADCGEDATRVVARVEEAFADLRYVRSLVES